MAGRSVARYRGEDKSPEKRMTDHCVIGETNVQALFQFQSNNRLLAKLFKPMFDRFYIDFSRKALPEGDKNE